MGLVKPLVALHRDDRAPVHVVAHGRVLVRERRMNIAPRLLDDSTTG